VKGVVAVPFVTPADLSVRAVDDRLWRVLAELIYQGRDQVFVVPVGFLTDFASVPQAVQWLVPTTGRYTMAAVLHDWLCTEGIRLGLISPRDVDALFRRVMREAGVPLVRRWLMWTAVRWGALLNPVRRPGWWHDAPAVLALSVLALPLLLPTIPVLVALGVDRLIEL
jgi:hypothetical protein